MAEVNIYASSIARCVLIWISIVLLFIGLIWNFIAKKIEEKQGMGEDIALTAMGFVPGAGTAISVVGGIGKAIRNHGGKVLIFVNAALLLLYEAFWHPWKHLPKYNLVKKDESDKDK